MLYVARRLVSKKVSDPPAAHSMGLRPLTPRVALLVRTHGLSARHSSMASPSKASTATPTARTSCGLRHRVAQTSIGRCKATRAPASRPMQALFPDYLVPRAEDDGVTPSDDGHDGGGCFIYVDTDGSPLQSLLPWRRASARWQGGQVGGAAHLARGRRAGGVRERRSRSGDTTISVFHLSDGSLFCVAPPPLFIRIAPPLPMHAHFIILEREPPRHRTPTIPIADARARTRRARSPPRPPTIMMASRWRSMN